MVSMASNLRTRTAGVALWRKLKPKARAMRREPTPAEAVLWAALRGRQTRGFRFRRQQPLDRFIVDFYCAEARLVIEVDGPIHDHSREEDAARESALRAMGFHVMRFSNDSVITSKQSVVREIQAHLAQLSSIESSTAKKVVPSPLGCPGNRGEMGMKALCRCAKLTVR
jgi:very-short-patch-repair endonuclease